MIREKPFVFALIAAVVAGVAVVIGATIWLNAFEASKITRLVTAVVDIPAGESLTSQNIKLTEWTGANIPAGALMEITPLLTRVARSNILSGDVLRDSVLVPLVADGSLAAAISPGKRAFSIRVTEEGGVAGFVLPGNYVDILYVSKDNSGKAVSDLLLSNILVLAIAQERNQANRSEPKVVNVITLEVSPEQAEKISQAHASGTLSLNLRNQLDKTELVESKSSQNEPIPTSNTKSSARGSYPSIEVIRGTARNTE